MRRASKIAVSAALLAAAVIAGPLAGSASAATCSVPGTYATVQQAVNDTTCDPITVAAGTFTGSFVVDRSVTITGAGPGQTILAGSTGSTTFDADAPGGTIVASGLTITHAPAATGAGVGVQSNTTLNLADAVASGNTNFSSGGVFVSGGTLNLARTTIVGNTSTGFGLAAAGINVSGGAVNVADSTISGNSATVGDGGGVGITNPATVALVNSTISGNSTNSDGGGLAVFDATSVTLTDVTLANNTADADASGTGDGGGVFIDTSAPVRLRNTIVANNVDRGGQAPDCGTAGAGALTRLGYVLLRSQTGCTIGGAGDDPTGFQTGADPMLGPLAANGGPTQTMALLAGSPALDAIPGASCAVATDQRGISRPQGSGCDLGAFELQVATPDTTPPETKIKKAKINRAARKAKFKFTSSETGSTFLCKLDKKKFKPCSSPKLYKHLRPGKHKFKVMAVDAAGNADPSPAKRKFRI
jgi:hypothetical protein